MTVNTFVRFFVRVSSLVYDLNVSGLECCTRLRNNPRASKSDTFTAILYHSTHSLVFSYNDEATVAGDFKVRNGGSPSQYLTVK